MPAHTPTPARRGRPRGFDLDAVTAALEQALWSRGYRATSVEELATHAGLSVSSLYAAFGSKLGVLDAALARYEQQVGPMLDELECGDGGLADIEVFLQRVGDVLADPRSPAGCFIVNTMVEVAAGIPEVAQRTLAYRRRIEAALAAALSTAASTGAIAEHSVADRARLIQAALYGVLAASSANDAPAAAAGLGALVAELRRWSEGQPRPGSSSRGQVTMQPPTGGT